MRTTIDAATAAELQRLELQLLDPAIRGDTDRVLALLADDFFEFGSSGRVWTREATLELMATESYTPPVVENLQCHSLGRGVVQVTYRTVRDAGPAGRNITLRSSIWTDESGSWRMKFHQGTRTS